MLGTLLIILGLIWLGQKLISSAPQFVKKRAISYRRDEGGEDRISALPDDLLAPILERLTIKLGPHCPVNANVGMWIGNAVDRRVFVDVSSPVCLPSLKRLLIVFVVYKDDDSVVRLLSSCPILEYMSEAFSRSWKKPNEIPPCLSTKLKIFEWKEYGATSEEKQVLSYILANSKCLKRAGISLKSTWKWNKKKIMKELKSMYRISTTSQLLFSTQLEFKPLWTPFRNNVTNLKIGV
ncbi:unnamed protein product [Arabidopsis thaliana]|uniref:FBD domain-containing protein n=1 Tax=Arabidopsis thaliana TaxID=3702 RepID=A0A654G6T3_ARATH|nr:unnamed protein product [Arabidopsis thaliana]